MCMYIYIYIIYIYMLDSSFRPFWWPFSRVSKKKNNSPHVFIIAQKATRWVFTQMEVPQNGWFIMDISSIEWMRTGVPQF